MAKRWSVSTSVKRVITFARFENVYLNCSRDGKSDCPKPGKSGATTRYRSDSFGIRFRNMWLDVGKPCSSSSGGPFTGPASRYVTPKPSTSTRLYLMTLISTSISENTYAYGKGLCRAVGSVFRRRRLRDDRDHHGPGAQGARGAGIRGHVAFVAHVHQLCC